MTPTVRVVVCAPNEPLKVVDIKKSAKVYTELVGGNYSFTSFLGVRPYLMLCSSDDFYHRDGHRKCNIFGFDKIFAVTKRRFFDSSELLDNLTCEEIIHVYNILERQMKLEGREILKASEL